MEKGLVLRKKSQKPLLVLLGIAEELLFSFPVSEEVAVKYSEMRVKVFTKMKLKHTPLPMWNNKIKEGDGKENVAELELVGLLQSMKSVNESFVDELEFNVNVYGNLFNVLADLFGIEERLEIFKEIEESSLSENKKEYDIEEEIEKYTQKVKKSNEKLKWCKNFLMAREKKIMDLVEVIRKMWKSEKKDIEEKYSDRLISAKNNEKEYMKRIEMLSAEISGLNAAWESEKQAAELQISALQLEIAENSYKSLDVAVEKVPDRLEEVIKLKNQLAFTEAALVNKDKELLFSQEETEKLLKNNNDLSKKLHSFQMYQSKLESECESLKTALAQERLSFESHQNSLQNYCNSKESGLKLTHEEALIALSEAHEKTIEKLKLSHEQTLVSMRSELQTIKSQSSSSFDSNANLIKALQAELKFEKEKFLNQTAKITEKFENSKQNYEEVIEKFENDLVQSLNALNFLHETLLPVYENHAHLQKDWNIEQWRVEIGENKYSEVMIYAEFCVFYLEKTLRDSAWLINKLSEVQTETKLNKTVSVGTLANVKGFQSSKTFKKIWKDMKETSESLKNFEKSRENLVSFFNHY